MKIIHCADVHLGSPMKKLNDRAVERAAEIRATFERLTEYAKKNAITNILLAGDVFDSDRPFKKDKEFFYKVVENNPDLQFFYLRGNHDGKESFTKQLNNLHTFSGEWTSYGLGENAVISGLELSSANRTSLYSTLRLDPEKINIVTLHGDRGGTGNNKIDEKKLAGKGIDYLALGHYHTFYTQKLDGRGTLCYSGCLEGRGFDETGEKGFAVFDTGTKEVKFVPFARRTVREITVDISGVGDENSAIRKIKSEIGADGENLLRLNLTGDVGFLDEGLATEVEKRIEGDFYCVSVKDLTRVKVDYGQYENELSLRGEFVRVVRESAADGDAERIIAMGLKALSGQKDL